MLREFKEGPGTERDLGPRKRHKGTRGRVRRLSRSKPARRYDAAALWHSVGGKVAGDPRLWKCCNPDTRLVHSRAFVISSACDWRGRSFLGPSRSFDTQYGEVLPEGHCACILVDRVEKPTDDKTLAVLCRRH